MAVAVIVGVRETRYCSVHTDCVHIRVCRAFRNDKRFVDHIIPAVGDDLIHHVDSQWGVNNVESHGRGVRGAVVVDGDRIVDLVTDLRQRVSSFHHVDLRLE